jgi:hypothetical protein
VEVHLANGTRLVIPCHEHEALRVVLAALSGDGDMAAPCGLAEDRTC